MVARELWVLAGQSNMEGIGSLHGPIEPPHPHVRVYTHRDRWEQAVEPLHWLLESPDPVHATLMGIPDDEIASARADARRARTQGAGLGLAFASTVATATGLPLDLVPCAHRGTSMRDWDPARAGEGGRSLYGALLRRVRAALASSPQSRLAGVLWYQGESECSPDGAARYSERMTAFVRALRRDLGRELPFYLVQLGRYALREPEATSDESWTRVREAQRLLPDSVPGVHVVPAIDLELEDSIHVGTRGLRRLGRRLASVALADVYGHDVSCGITVDRVERRPGRIVVRFGGVTKALRVPDPAGRVPGFTMTTAAGELVPHAFFDMRLDRDDPHAVELVSVEGAAPAGLVSHGWGLNPFCQLTDAADHAVPAFGPMDAVAEHGEEEPTGHAPRVQSVPPAEA